MKRTRVCVVVVVLGAAACTDDALCADEITTVNVHDIFDDSEDGVTVARDDNGMVTLTARERSIAVQATFPTDVELDDVIGEVELTVGTTVIGEGTESNYLTVVDERGVLFTGGRHPTFDRLEGGGYDADSPFSLGEATGTHCEGYELYGVRMAFDDGAVDVDNTPLAGTLRGMPVHAQATSASKLSFFATEEAIDGYGVGPHTQSNLTAWAWRTR